MSRGWALTVRRSTARIGPEDGSVLPQAYSLWDFTEASVHFSTLCYGCTLQYGCYITWVNAATVEDLQWILSARLLVGNSADDQQ